MPSSRHGMPVPQASARPSRGDALTHGWRRCTPHARNPRRLRKQSLPKLLIHINTPMSRLYSLLERIATSLEKIAESLAGPVRKAQLSPRDTSAVALPGVVEQNKPQSCPCPLISSFLEERGIAVKTLPPQEASDAIINSLGDFLGNNYNCLRELMGRIKRGMHNGDNISLSLKEYSQKDLSNVCQFATRLHQIAFLEQYSYQRSPHFMLRAKCTCLPRAQNFFAGKWLERYALVCLQRAIERLSQSSGQALEFSYMLNPQVILPNGDDFELDMLWQLEGRFFWLEAKSGDYQQHIAKYARVAKILGLGQTQSIMLLADIDQANSQALTSLFDMQVLNLENLEEQLFVLMTGEKPA